LEVDPKSKGVRFVLGYLEQVEKGKAPADKDWLHTGKDTINKVPGTVTCQFKEHIFLFVRSRMVTMISFGAILHNPHYENEKSISLLNVTMPTPYREVDYTILQYHGKGVMRYRCGFHAHMNEAVGRPIYDAPPILRKEGEVKPEKTANV
jgi:hypothetical protein